MTGEEHGVVPVQALRPPLVHLVATEGVQVVPATRLSQD